MLLSTTNSSDNLVTVNLALATSPRTQIRTWNAVSRSSKTWKSPLKRPSRLKLWPGNLDLLTRTLFVFLAQVAVRSPRMVRPAQKTLSTLSPNSALTEKHSTSFKMPVVSRMTTPELSFLNSVQLWNSYMTRESPIAIWSLRTAFWIKMWPWSSLISALQSFLLDPKDLLSRLNAVLLNTWLPKSAVDLTMVPP